MSHELDFRHEARNADAARAALEASGSGLASFVLIPEVLSEFTTARTLVTGFVPDMLRLDSSTQSFADHGIDAAEIASLLSRVYAELVLEHGLVHGDLHLGNVYSVSGYHNDKETFAREKKLVLLDWGLVHHIDEHERLMLCELYLLCATPFPQVARIRKLASELAGPLSGLFPLLLSPAFALASDLPAAELLAAAESRLPDSISLDDVWRALEALRGRAPALIGTMHSLGYVRGALGVLHFQESKRVTHLAITAATVLSKSGHPEYHRYRRLPKPVVILFVRFTVWLLFSMLWVIQRFSYFCAGIKRASSVWSQ